MKWPPAKKEILLSTTLENLGVKGLVSKAKIKYWQKDNQSFPTLKEFIEANNSILLKQEARFNLYGIAVQSLAWKDLKNFLINEGFTSKDFIMLCPKKKVGLGNSYDLATLSKEQIKNLTIGEIFHSIHTSSRYGDNDALKLLGNMYLHNFSPNVDEYPKEPYLIKNLLNVFNVDNPNILFKYSDRRGFVSLAGIQKALKKLGFTEKDGYFMSMIFTNLHPKQYYVDRLINEKDFSEAEATEAVEIGLRAGWITARDN